MITLEVNKFEAGKRIVIFINTGQINLSRDFGLLVPAEEASGVGIYFFHFFQDFVAKFGRRNFPILRRAIDPG